MDDDTTLLVWSSYMTEVCDVIYAHAHCCTFALQSFLDYAQGDLSCFPMSLGAKPNSKLGVMVGVIVTGWLLN